MLYLQLLCICDGSMLERILWKITDKLLIYRTAEEFKFCSEKHFIIFLILLSRKVKFLPLS